MTFVLAFLAGFALVAAVFAIARRSCVRNVDLEERLADQPQQLADQPQQTGRQGFSRSRWPS